MFTNAGTSCPLESSRQPPDTPQTPSRHPQLEHFLAISRPLGEKEAANKNESNGMFMNCLHIICTLPDNIQSHKDNPRHFPTTFQTSYTQPKVWHFLPNQGNWEKRESCHDTGDNGSPRIPTQCATQRLILGCWERPKGFKAAKTFEGRRKQIKFGECKGSMAKATVFV